MVNENQMQLVVFLNAFPEPFPCMAISMFSSCFWGLDLSGF